MKQRGKRETTNQTQMVSENGRKTARVKVKKKEREKKKNRSKEEMKGKNRVRKKENGESGRQR
jgi:hypothetical protein